MVMLNIEQKSKVVQYNTISQRDPSSQHRESLSFFNCQHASCAKKKQLCDWTSSLLGTDLSLIKVKVDVDGTLRKEQQTLSEKSSPLSQAAHRSARGMSLILPPDPLSFLAMGVPEGPSLQGQSDEPWRQENDYHTVGTDDHDRHMWKGEQWDGNARQPLHAPKWWPLGAGFVTRYLSRLKSYDDSGTKLNCSVNVLNTLAHSKWNRDILCVPPSMFRVIHNKGDARLNSSISLEPCCRYNVIFPMILCLVFRSYL